MEKNTSTTRVLVTWTPANAQFYRKHGFAPIPGTADKLYLSATTLLQVSGSGKE